MDHFDINAHYLGLLDGCAFISLCLINVNSILDLYFKKQNPLFLKIYFHFSLLVQYINYFISDLVFIQLLFLQLWITFTYDKFKFNFFRIFWLSITKINLSIYHDVNIFLLRLIRFNDNFSPWQMHIFGWKWRIFQVIFIIDKYF